MTPKERQKTLQKLRKLSRMAKDMQAQVEAEIERVSNITPVADTRSPGARRQAKWRSKQDAAEYRERRAAYMRQLRRKQNVAFWIEQNPQQQRALKKANPDSAAEYAAGTKYEVVAPADSEASSSDR